MTRGKLYLLKGGHVLRYHGPWGSGEANSFQPVDPKAIGHAFCPPSHDLTDVAVGYSAAEGDVIQEVTREDAPWLRDRLAQLIARDMTIEAAEVERVLREVCA